MPCSPCKAALTPACTHQLNPWGSSHLGLHCPTAAGFSSPAAWLHPPMRQAPPLQDTPLTVSHIVVQYHSCTFMASQGSVRATCMTLYISRVAPYLASTFLLPTSLQSVDSTVPLDSTCAARGRDTSKGVLEPPPSIGPSEGCWQPVGRRKECMLEFERAVCGWIRQGYV